MRSRWMLLVLTAGVWLAGPGFVPGQSPRDPSPPWKPFAVCFAPGSDGKPVAVMLTPGPTQGSWVAIVGGSAVWQIAPLSEPPPTPPPPSPPTLADEAKKAALDAAQRLPPEGRQEDSQKLAAVYKTLAGQIPKTIDSIDKLITANRYAREVALGPQRAQAWEPWVKEMGAWLDAKRTAGAIKTVDDCKPVWLAIAEGLAAVQGGSRR